MVNRERIERKLMEKIDHRMKKTRNKNRKRTENEICLLILDRKYASVCDKKTNFHQKLPEISQFYRKHLLWCRRGWGWNESHKSWVYGSTLEASKLRRVVFFLFSKLVKRKSKLASFKEANGGVTRLNPSQTRVINVSSSIDSRNVDICQCRHKTFNQPFECRNARALKLFSLNPQ